MYFIYSVRREVLYKILIEFGIPWKLVRLIKMSLADLLPFGAEPFVFQAAIQTFKDQDI